VRPGDQLLGLPSSGLHSNGFSLARKVFFDQLGLTVGDRLPGGDRLLGQELLTPTRLYPGPVLPLVEQGWVKAMAHITGGGLMDNLPRVLPAGCGARVQAGSWPDLPVFNALRAAGGVAETEMRRTFNLGLGMVLIAAAEEAARIEADLASRNEPCYRIGEVAAGERQVSFV
jgi:phosphoribosylformylglycinamidine cyclo-ligase